MLKRDETMFTTQIGLYEQVKQNQLEMERSAQLDLEIAMADPGASSLPTHLRGLLANWGNQLQHSLAERLASFVVMAVTNRKTI
jgi:hypothetical protein